LTVIEEVEKELQYQKDRWGEGHDEEHSFIDWIVLLGRYVSKSATPEDALVFKPASFRRRMIQVAAIAISAAQSTEV